MKKIKVIFLIIIFILIIPLLTTQSSTLTVEAYSNSTVPSNVSLAFSVLGDIHNYTDNFQQGISDLYRINPRMDAIILNGDTTDQGVDKLYTSIERTLKSNSALLPKIIIKNIGNHEFFDYNKSPNTNEAVQGFLDKYYAFSGEKNVYHDTWIKGYHFISLGSEIGNTKEIGSVQAFISDTQQKWLKEKLSEKYEKGKPIFVFLHQHLSKKGGNLGWVGVKQDSEIKKILAKYPEVFIFNSHTHQALQDENVTLNQPYTMVHTGAVSYVRKLDDKGAVKKIPEGQGLYIEVYKNKVLIKGRDFERRKWIFEKEVSK